MRALPLLSLAPGGSAVCAGTHLDDVSAKVAKHRAGKVAYSAFVSSHHALVGRWLCTRRRS